MAGPYVLDKAVHDLLSWYSFLHMCADKEKNATRREELKLAAKHIDDARELLLLWDRKGGEE